MNDLENQLVTDDWVVILPVKMIIRVEDSHRRGLCKQVEVFANEVNFV